MSGPDQDKSFLARWAQRKSEARQPAPDAAVADTVADVPAAADAEPEFDPASLPNLEEMTSATDITGFLRKGVPEQLRNAALRKSWALDPAIRNYVSPALEYAYDWNTPGGVPGNGDIAVGTDIAKMVLQIMGSGETTAEAAPPPDIPDEGVPASADVADQQSAGDFVAEAVRLSDAEDAPQGIANRSEPAGTEVDQPMQPENSIAPQQAVRRHGSAKPLV
ncbi:MAG TPA: DUF3306 domain-containing protein [Tardiphaga sp.]